MTTKIHLAADSRCRPLAFVVTPGQAGDALVFPQVMVRLRVPRPVGKPRATPDVVPADKAYSSRAIRSHLRRRGIRAVIPAAPRPGRQPQTSRQPRWQTTGIRPRGLQTTEHRRAVHQQAQTVARPGHPLRQDRHHLPRRTPPRRHLHLVSEVTRRKRPSGRLPPPHRRRRDLGRWSEEPFGGWHPTRRLPASVRRGAGGGSKTGSEYEHDRATGHGRG
ncbi:transposase [Streptomyces sp. NPDC029674]|uniref:transposase n=1 Tax=Streptomyces sp. NPDC029674 TaxID=3365297 RepID=UPI003850C19B